MTRFTKTAFAAAIALLMPIAGNALAVNHGSFDLASHRYKGGASVSASSPFESERMQRIRHANSLLDGGASATRATEVVEQPKLQSIGPASNITDLDTPWGETWFYSSQFRYSYIKVSEYYTSPILEEYEFTIYDSTMKEVGKIKDKMTYVTYDELRDPDKVANKNDLELYGPYHREVAVASCELTPMVTKHFFNTDDKYEIMVGLSVQTTYYVNNNYNRIYQLGGETYQTEDFTGAPQTYDKMVDVLTHPVGDIYASTDEAGNEKVYMTLMEDINSDVDFEFPDFVEGDDVSDIVIPGYWENYCGNGLSMVTYRGVRDGETEIQPVFKKDMYISRFPGDMENTPFIISLENDGKVYLVSSYYDKPFWNRYDSPLAEMTMREGNSLVIEIYRENETGTNFDLIQTTKIPTYLTPDYGTEKYLASWFSVGDFRYRQDIRFGADGKASSFIITKADYVAGNDDASIRSYYVYDAEGNMVRKIFERSQSFIPMSDLPGFEPQTMFIDTDNMGDYVFHFIDLESVKEVLTLNYQFDVDPYSDPERMTSNIDRVVAGDTYKYADELRVPSQDEEGNDIGRILWFNRDGSFDHIDEVNMGKNVYYALSYIESRSLAPDFFYADGHHEYMMLVKRAYPGENPAEELLIAQCRNEDAPEGRVLLADGPDERGALGGISILDKQGQSLLLVSKINNNDHYWDVYALPFISFSGVEDVEADTNGAISYDGKNVCAAGHIVLYNIHGMKVAEGDDTVSTHNLADGLYIVTAAGQTRKIVVK